MSIALLGAPIVTVDGQPLRVDTRKATAVLAAVAVDGPTSRAALAARLWPDSDETRARGALRRTLSVLGSGLGGRWLLTTTSTVALDDDATEIDTRRLAEALREVAGHGHATGAVCSDCLAPLRQAAALHRGEFMEGFVLRDGAEFDEWRRAHAERLRRELCTVLERLVRAEAELGNLDGAMEAARDWLLVDPLNEQAYARMMVLHAWRGERGEAIRCYRECAATLDRELGVRPLARTSSLYRAIVEDRLERPTVERAAAPTATPPAADRDRRGAGRGGELPFVGRDAELERALEHLLAPGGRLVVVHGEAGIGKTRFVEELDTRLHQRGVEVLSVRCHPREKRLALGPIVEMLRSATDRRGAAERLTALPAHVRSEAGRLLPTIAGGDEPPPPVPLDTPGAHARFLSSIVTALLAAATSAEDRLVVVVEDVHAADEATVDLLCFLRRRLGEHDIGLVLTWRSDDASADAQLLRATTDAETTTRGLVLGLQRLGADATARLYEAAAGGPSSPEVTARLLEEAEGLPLALVEYLRWLVEAEADPTQDWPIPSGVRDLVDSRLDGLSETAMQITTATAVLGLGVDLPLLALTSGRSDEETVEGVEELVAGAILRAGPAGTYEFRHEKIRAVAYERAGPARRRLLHARAAEALAVRAGRRRGGHLAAVIAEHARLGGDEEEAATWSVRAGDHAAGVFANAEARRHYERALALDHPDPTEVHRRLGRLQLLEGDYRGALASYETAAAHAGDDHVLARVEHELGAVHLRRGRWASAQAHLGSALQHLSDDEPGEAARIASDLGLAELEAGDAGAARERAARALALAEEARDRQSLAQARNLMGLLARRRGEHAEAQRQLEHAAALASTLADPTAYIAALNNLALTTADAGELDRAVELLRTAIERCDRQGDRHRAAALHNNLADLHHLRGDRERASAHLTEAVTRFADVGEPATHDPEIWKLVDW